MPARTAVWPAVFVWPAMVKPVTVRLSASRSESLPTRLPVMVSSSVPATVSFVPTGASFTALRFSASVDVEVRLPSVMV